MIPETRSTLRPHGERDIMSNKKKRGKLSHELLGIVGLDTIVTLFFYTFLKRTSNSLVINYCDERNVILTEMQEIYTETWIQGICLMGAAIIFVVFFLLLFGQKIAYLKEIIRGIDALHAHRMDYVIPVEGNNELTELAESINYFSEAERELNRKEQELKEEREKFTRTLSHDIRTPLTSILSYSEFMKNKERLSEEEVEFYIELVGQKAEQIKVLTNKLLDADSRNLEYFESGKFLMEQLAEEWQMVLEDQFQCEVDLSKCEEFSGKFDIQELKRIFDNLSSNVEKYACPQKSVNLCIFTEEDKLFIEQENKKNKGGVPKESYKLGLESIRQIVKKYDGEMNVWQTEDDYKIQIFFRIL